MYLVVSLYLYEKIKQYTIVSYFLYYTIIYSKCQYPTRGLGIICESFSAKTWKKSGVNAPAGSARRQRAAANSRCFRSKIFYFIPRWCSLQKKRGKPHLWFSPASQGSLPFSGGGNVPHRIVDVLVRRFFTSYPDLLLQIRVFRPLRRATNAPRRWIRAAF